MKLRGDVVDLVKNWRDKGYKIAFSSGVFDLLHAGHVSSLQQAKKLADKLIVAVNTDASVRALKGKTRPIVPEAERLYLLDALACVDAAFLFDELNNKENILSFKPDIYVKAGDYSAKSLSSARYLKPEAKLQIVDIYKVNEGFNGKLSTSSRINDILLSSARHGLLPISEAPKPMLPKATVFLDRDGVINKEIDYLHKVEDMLIYPEVGPALKQLQEMGFQFIIVTNQPGIGLGYFSKEDFFRLNLALLKELNNLGIEIARIYYCPHTSAEKCECRKPSPFLIERGFREAAAKKSESVFIGDRTSDIQAAKNAGIPGILMKTGKAGEDKACSVSPDFVAETLLEAASWIGKKIPQKGKM